MDVAAKKAMELLRLGKPRMNSKCMRATLITNKDCQFPDLGYYKEAKKKRANQYEPGSTTIG
jgi:hypothetical protein